MMMHLNSLMNPILYSLTNTQLKNGFIDFLNLIYRFKKPVVARYIDQTVVTIKKTIIKN